MLNRVKLKQSFFYSLPNTNLHEKKIQDQVKKRKIVRKSSEEKNQSEKTTQQKTKENHQSEKGEKENLTVSNQFYLYIEIINGLFCGSSSINSAKITRLRNKPREIRQRQRKPILEKRR